MTTLLNIALSLGILVHAAALPLQVGWFFIGGPVKRFQTGLAGLAAIAGIFTYLVALVDEPELAFLGFGIMRGLFEVQRADFLRVLAWPTLIVFGLVFGSNALGVYAADASIAPVIVFIVVFIICNFLAFSTMFTLRKLQDDKASYSLIIGGAYMILVTIIFSLGAASFDVLPLSLEFFLYAGLDLIFLVLPSFAHSWFFYLSDDGVDGVTCIGIHDGVREEMAEVDGMQSFSVPVFEDEVQHEDWSEEEEYEELVASDDTWRAPPFIRE